MCFFPYVRPSTKKRKIFKKSSLRNKLVIICIVVTISWLLYKWHARKSSNLTSGSKDTTYSQENGIPAHQPSSSSVVYKGQIFDSVCDPPEHTVQKMFDYWSKKSNAFFTQLSTTDDSGVDLDDILKQRHLATDSDYCYAKFVFNGTVHLVENFTRHCSEPGLATSSLNRGLLYANVWNHLLMHPKRRHLTETWPSFSWYMDLTSGSRHNPELRRALKMPTLVAAANPHDDTVLVVPDAFYIIGVLSNSTWQSLIPEPLQYPAKQYHQRYFEIPAVMHKTWSWQLKVPRAVFRGSCHPTLNSSNARPHTRIWMRALLCQKLGNDSNFDVGVYVKGSASPCSSPHGMEKLSECQLCGRCSAAQPIAIRDMMKYKYQLLVDGHGPGYDSNMWKLLSGGVPIQVNPDENGDQPLFSMWYYPLLKNNTNYLSVSLRNLATAVGNGILNDKRSHNIAMNAIQLADCLLRLDVMFEYLWQVLIHLHRLR